MLATHQKPPLRRQSKRSKRHSKIARRRRQRPPRGFVDCLRHFLTPALWKQAHKARQVAKTSRSSRWRVQPLVLVLLFMTWCCGDSQAERFETAKALGIACLSKRRRPGQTVQGFQKALAHLPAAVLRLIGKSFRQTLAERLARRWYEGEFIPIGCDGSRVECPRSTELERRVGVANKKQTAPSLWITALVLLRLGVPWAWRIGKAGASERGHMEQMVACLPKSALLVMDAGFMSFSLAQKIMKANRHFLIRMSSSATLYTARRVRLQSYREGVVYYWPHKAQKAGELPLQLRLLCIRATKKKNNLWLLTNVMESSRLTPAMASQYYRWRWENEGQFCAYCTF